jgi:hypothetical protein
VQPRPPPKARAIPSGWQRTVDQTTGDPLYVNASSGSVVFKYNDMFRRLKKPPRQSHQAVTPTDRSIRSIGDNIIPDVAVSSLRYLTPPKMGPSSKYLDSTLAKPIYLDDDEVSMGSQVLSDLMNSQLPKKKGEEFLLTRWHLRCHHREGVWGDWWRRVYHCLESQSPCRLVEWHCMH